MAGRVEDIDLESVEDDLLPVADHLQPLRSDAARTAEGAAGEADDRELVSGRGIGEPRQVVTVDVGGYVIEVGQVPRGPDVIRMSVRKHHRCGTQTLRSDVSGDLRCSSNPRVNQQSVAPGVGQDVRVRSRPAAHETGNEHTPILVACSFERASGYPYAMERESNKHNPRVDEEMKREVASITHGAPVDSRAEEFREHEAPADGEPTSDGVISTDQPGTGSLTPEEVELRQDLARSIDRIFPATKEELVSNAIANGAPERVVAWYKRLPDRSYEGFPQVWEVGSGHTEPRAV